MNRLLDEIRRDMNELHELGQTPDYPKMLEALKGNPDKVEEVRRQYIRDRTMGRLER